MVRASGNSGGDNLTLIAPLHLDSPVGQLLSQILQSHPHLFLATVDQQLENLQSQRDGQEETTTPSSSQDLLLYKRIAEIQEKERIKILEEIMYCLIVQRFVDNDISMIPKIASDPTGRIDLHWTNQEHKLESVHSSEAMEMILSHLPLVLWDRVVNPLDSTIQMSKIKLGKLHAALIMYGYFIRRVDERYELERSMNTLPEDFGEDSHCIFGDGIVDSSSEERSYKLRTYVLHFDFITRERYQTIRSKEAKSLIEKQTQALFGMPDIMFTEDGTVEASNDEVVCLTLSGLKMLVLEAMTFGSCLWDAEIYVESKYPFIFPIFC